MKLQSKKRKLIKSTENLFRSFTCVDACSARNDATHTANQHREIEHWYIAKIAQKNNHRKRGKKNSACCRFFVVVYALCTEYESILSSERSFAYCDQFHLNESIRKPTKQKSLFRHRIWWSNEMQTWVYQSNRDVTSRHYVHLPIDVCLCMTTSYQWHCKQFFNVFFFFSNGWLWVFLVWCGIRSFFCTFQLGF